MTDITAVVLAAGAGTRMASLKSGRSKVMLTIMGKPVLEYVLENIKDTNIQKVIVVLLERSADQITSYFGKKWKDLDIKYVVIKEPLGPSYALNEVKNYIETPYFLVQYADSLAEENLPKKVLETFNMNPKVDGVLALREVDDPSRYGIVEYKGNKIVKIVDKPGREKAKSNHATIGTFILKTSLFKKAIENEKFTYDNQLFPAEYMLKNGAKIISYFFQGKRVDVGKPEDLFNASQLLAKSQIKCIAFDADNTLYDTHEAAKIADLKAIKILADKINLSTESLYETWKDIVRGIKQSMNPQTRTRKYSYNLLTKKYDQDSKLTETMNSTFRTTLLNNLKPIGQIARILPHLSQEKIIITEDSEDLTGPKLKTVGLSKFFNKIITSHKVGTMKPSPKFYKTLLSKFDAQEILVVGDNWQKDLQIPSELGMQVMFIQGGDDLKRLLTLRGPISYKAGPLKRVHFMGAAGAGASAVAGIAKAYGFEVSGCDLNPQSPYTKNLKVKIKKGHSPSHLLKTDLLVVSPAVEKLDPKNPELQEAKVRKIPTITWQEFQGKFLQQDKFVITVAGGYGKSTTTGMISQILIDAGFDPTCEIGAKVLEWGNNFRVGKSKYYVCESDEYNNNFLNYDPDIAIVLNVAWDHPDFFKTQQSVANSYKKFISRIKRRGTLIIPDSLNLGQFAKSARRDVKITKVEAFDKIKLSLIGDFRKENASAALTVAQILGIGRKVAKKSVENFKGLGRRLEYKGQIGGIKFYDDYAVQPYTIQKTADALKSKFKDKNVTLVLEPHTFSRIEAFFKDFVTNLKNTKVDRVLITNVYAAREQGDNAQLATELAQSVGSKAKYTGSLQKTADYIKSHYNAYQVILSMGAGDVYKLYDLVKER